MSTIGQPDPGSSLIIEAQTDKVKVSIDTVAGKGTITLPGGKELNITNLKFGEKTDLRTLTQDDLQQIATIIDETLGKADHLKSPESLNLKTFGNDEGQHKAELITKESGAKEAAKYVLKKGESTWTQIGDLFRSVVTPDPAPEQKPIEMTEFAQSNKDTTGVTTSPKPLIAGGKEEGPHEVPPDLQIEATKVDNLAAKSPTLAARKARETAEQKATDSTRDVSLKEQVERAPHSITGEVYAWGDDKETQLYAATGIISDIDVTGESAKIHTGRRMGVTEDGRLLELQERATNLREGHRFVREKGVMGTEGLLFASAVSTVPKSPGKAPWYRRFILRPLAVITGYYVLQDLIFRKLFDNVTMFTLGEGAQREKLSAMMEQEGGAKTNENIGESKQRYQMGRTKRNKLLGVEHKPVHVLKGLKKVLTNTNKGTSKNPTQAVKDGNIVCPEQYLDNAEGAEATVVTFATRMKHDHNTRRAEKATGPWGAKANWLKFWKSTETITKEYGAKKAAQARKKDQTVLEEYNGVMDAAAQNAGTKGEVPPKFNPKDYPSSNDIRDMRDNYKTIRYKMDQDLTTIRALTQQIETETDPTVAEYLQSEKDKLIAGLEPQKTELNKAHKALTESQEMVANAMLEIHVWTKNAIENPESVTQEQLDKLEEFRTSIHDTLKELAIGEGEWTNKAKSIATESTSMMDTNLQLDRLGHSFVSMAEVRELRSLLEMTEGAVQLARAQLGTSDTAKQILENKDLSTEQKQEALTNFGEMVYSELDHHFQVWIFNEHISPTITHLDHFCQYTSVFGLYRFGPTLPNAELLERFPPLEANITEQYNNSLKGPAEMRDSKSYRNEKRVDMGSYLKHNRNCESEFGTGENNKTYYRFTASIEGEGGHKSYILDPVNKEGKPVENEQKRGLFLSIGTRFGDEIYGYRKRPRPSGVRADLETSTAEAVVKEKVDYNGQQMEAHAAIGDYMKNSPYKYVCAGHSLGATTVQGLVCSDGFPVDKIAHVGAFAGPGIRESDNVRFYESAMNVLENEALPNTVTEAVFGDITIDSNLPFKERVEIKKEVQNYLGEQLKNSTGDFDVALKNAIENPKTTNPKVLAALQNMKVPDTIEKKEVLQSSVDMMREASKNKAKIDDLKGKDKLTKQEKAELKEAEENHSTALYEARRDLEEGGFTVTDKMPTCMNLTAKWDIVGHLGTAPYQLGLLEGKNKEKYRAAHQGCATVMCHKFVGEKGPKAREWHNDQALDNAFKGTKRTEIRLEMSEEMSTTRRVIKKPTRALWRAAAPVRGLMRGFLIGVTERYRRIYGYGTEHAKHGIAREHNVCTVIPQKAPAA